MTTLIADATCLCAICRKPLEYAAQFECSTCDRTVCRDCSNQHTLSPVVRCKACLAAATDKVECEKPVGSCSSRATATMRRSTSQRTAIVLHAATGKEVKLMARTEGAPGRERVKGRLISFRFTFQVLAFLMSIQRGERTAFIEKQIEASSQYQSWQKTRG